MRDAGGSRCAMRGRTRARAQSPLAQPALRLLHRDQLRRIAHADARPPRRSAICSSCAVAKASASAWCRAPRGEPEVRAASRRALALGRPGTAPAAGSARSIHGWSERHAENRPHAALEHRPVELGAKRDQRRLARHNSRKSSIAGAGSTPASCVCAADAVDQDVGVGARPVLPQHGFEAVGERRCTPRHADGADRDQPVAAQVEPGGFGVDDDVALPRRAAARGPRSRSVLPRAEPLLLRAADLRPSQQVIRACARRSRCTRASARSQLIGAAQPLLQLASPGGTPPSASAGRPRAARTGSIRLAAAVRRRQVLLPQPQELQEMERLDGRVDVPRLDVQALAGERAAAPRCRSPAMPSASANTRAQSTKSRVPRALRSSVPLTRRRRRRRRTRGSGRAAARPRARSAPSAAGTSGSPACSRTATRAARRTASCRRTAAGSRTRCSR